MFCGMNFTTTGIEFGQMKPSILRVEHYQPLTAAVPMSETQLANGTPILATKATQRGERVLAAPQLGQKRAKGQNRRLAGPLETKRWSNASSSSSLSDNRHSCGLTKKNTSKAASAGQSISKDSRSLASHKSHQSQNDSQPLKKKAVESPPEKRVRFAMDVQERTVPPDPGPPSETCSSDGSDCSYIDPPPPTEPEGAISGHTNLPNASESHRYRPGSMTVRSQPAKRFANKPNFDSSLRSKGQSAVSKAPPGTRLPEPIVVIWSDLKESNGKESSSRRPTVIKTALKNSFAGQHSTASNNDKENSLGYDERLGLTFRDV